MRVEDVDEAVAVGAVFRGSRIIPRWFVWGRTKREIKAVNMVWRGKEGEALLRYFSVSAEGNTYQLRLNQKTMEWRLEKVLAE